MRTSGFTLIEILIAIGILSVGLLCAAAMFPAAVKENQNSFSNSMGSLICENGLAILRSKMKHEALDGKCNVWTSLESVNGTNYIGKDGRYPSGVGDPPAWSGMGFTGMIRQMGGQNDYLITVVSYSLLESGTAAQAKVFAGGTLADVRPAGSTGSGTIDANTKYVTSRFNVGGSDIDKWFQRDALVVLYVGGSVIVGRVDYVDGNNVYFDRRLTAAGLADACVVAEVKGNPAVPLSLPSPVMSVVTARVGL